MAMSVNTQPTYPDVRVRLSGRDGNAGGIIGAVTGALRRKVNADAANTFARAAFMWPVTTTCSGWPCTPGR
jgi:hypothetical protein